jgi:PTH1 family peptidyl-tRNA hydrolase
MVLELLAAQLHAPPFREKFSGMFTRGTSAGTEVALLKPTTFMNLSGESAQKALHFFKLGAPEMIVVHDDLDLPYGQLRLKQGGGTAGHNGLKSLVQHCGPEFSRLRVGIGRPGPGRVENYVLSDFTADERISLSDVLESAASALTLTVARGVTDAMNRVNSRPA